MKCENCGAEVNSSAGRCEYCGSSLTGLPGSDATPRQILFARLRRSPLLAQNNLRQLEDQFPKPGPLALAIPVVFLLIFISAAGFMAISAFHEAPAGFAIVPGGFVVLGVMMIGFIVQKHIEVRNAPPLARPAVVASKRTSSSTGSDGQSSTSYHVTFELEDGRRSEYTVPHAAFTAASEGDGGALVTRADSFQGFQQIS
jgi:hypothetical protein